MIITWILFAVGVLVVLSTLLPLWRTSLWWVRILDFPRFQIAILGTAVAAGFGAWAWKPSTVDAAFLIAVLAAVLWQATWIWRYIPGAPLEVRNAHLAKSCVRFLTANVYQTCRDIEGLLVIIKDADPDVILAVETDEWWCARLSEGLRSHYPHELIYPLSNGYGMALFSRYELIEPAIRFSVDEAVPSIKTGVLITGAVVDLYGVHPQPPAPGQSSEERDRELVLVGREIGRSRRPAVVLGDLNDVAWSETTTQFKNAGNLLDPRRGRGFFNTYPANMPGMRYPLDYIFHTEHFAVSEMRVLPRFKSDHLPLVATLCLTDE